MALRTWIVVILVILVLGLWFYAETTKAVVKAVGGVTAGISAKAVDKVTDNEKYDDQDPSSQKEPS